MSSPARRAVLLVGASLLAASAHAQSADLPPGATSVASADQGQVIVTGRRSNQGAREEQRAAFNLINIQPAEEIRKYPDFNAAESLGRIPGVSLSTDTGEGRFVNIRGIDGNLNGTTFGGVTLLNTQPGGTYFGGGGRAVELDTIPIGAIDRLVVRKTGLPDQEAEGLGGSVELTPRTAQGIKRSFLEGTIGGGYQPAHGHAGVYRAELTGALRFGPDQTFGVLAYGSYHEDGRGFDDVEPAFLDDSDPSPTNRVLDAVDLRRYNYNRRRFGFGAELTYDPSPQHHYYVRVDDAGYTERVNRQLLNYNNLGVDVNGDVLAPGADAYTAPTAGAELTLRDEQETHLNFITAVGGRDDFGSVVLDYQGSYTSSTYHRDYDYNSTFATNAEFPVTYSFYPDTGLPRLGVTGFDPNNSAQFTLDGFRNAAEGAHDREWAGSVNVTVPVRLIGTNESIKVGGKLRLRDKRDTPTSVSYDVPGTPLTQLLGPGPYNNFYNGNYAIGYAPSYLAIRSLFKADPGLFPQISTLGARGTITRNASAFFNDTENVYAGYAQYQGTFGRLSVLAGVRVENTDATYRGNTVTFNEPVPVRPLPDLRVPVITPSARKSSYTDAFPTVQLRYDFGHDLIARATYSTGIGRPGFLQVQAGSTVDVGARSVSIGNPDLKPTTVNAFDVTLEKYLPNSGVLSIGFFDKEFNDYALFRGQANVNYLGDGTLFRVSSYSNVKDSYARGLEAQYVQKFSHLPGVLSGLGFTGNVTYVDSRIEIRPGEFSRLPGTSKLTWNIGGFYEAHGAQVRITMQNVEASIFQVGRSAGSDVFQDDKTQVDLTASYDVTRQVNVYFNARNLTNGPLRYYEGFKNRPIQREYYDVSYEAGVRFHF